MSSDTSLASRPDALQGIGVVLIGRNEGERLQRCLESVAAHRVPIVYVDSGSTDTSVQRAEAIGAEVVFLSNDTPFTAARARNAGFERLIQTHDDIAFVQFVDGDCEVVAGWLQDAYAFLNAHDDAAVVCGRRKERFPEHSRYNQLCDIEWDTDIGETDSCGGDALMRVTAFTSVGGFNGNLIAGEEPEMCYRMRLAGWKIFRIDSLMTLHDAAMRTFGQWARRSARSGYAYAARAFLHWRDFNGYCLREIGRIVFWGMIFPLAAAAAALAFSPWFAALFLIYAVQYLRILRGKIGRYSSQAARTYAFFTVLGKWTELYGIVVCIWRIVMRKEQRLIEYK